MSDKPETRDAILGMEYNGAEGHETDTVASIVEEMRETWTDTPPCILSDLADRIEAAAERERIAHTNDIHDALYKATGIPGNAAEMRESIETMRRYAMIPQEELSLSLLQRTIHEKCDAALAAPARNCDRFATAEEARRAFEAAHSQGIVHNLYTTSFDWLFATAEGGDNA